MGRASLSIAALLLAALLASCADRTSILVEVSSPLLIPDDIDQLQVEVVGDVAGGMADRTFDVMTTWPHSVSIRPGATESQAITVRVTARRQGAFVARRVARSRFVRGEQIVVRVLIDPLCDGVMCPGSQDCVGGRCVDITPLDGGVADGRVGAGCQSTLDCDDSVPCTTDVCDNGSCTHEPDDSLCQKGTTCDVAAGCPPRVCENDAQCNDGVTCNGSEVCVGMTCAPGLPVDCNDADPCTTDRCDEGMRGVCVSSTRDADGDGFGDVACPEAGGVPATDCNDGNADANPDAVEVCNGTDDDCNGTCDEPATCCRGEIGACMSSCGTAGSRVCGASCAWGVCSPPAEQCNAIDDDCNGAADDIFACVQGASEGCTTSCGSTGTRTCQSDCTWSDCAAPAETCNGADDDCSGAADDTFSCVRGTSIACTTSCGSTGSQTCQSDCTMSATCVPPAEGCNGVDDNCDGRIDETVECSPSAVQPCTTSCGSMGSRTCSAMCMFGSCTPPAEVCNGLDDNCDGRVDETFTCVPNAMRVCTTGCGTSGTQACNASCGWGACTPPAESCNGLDDNCNSMCDESFTCCAGAGGTCMTGCGSMGTRTCMGNCSWSACSPPAEVCNGMDDDCNSACDDGFTCCAGRTGSCTTGCGSMGTRLCSASCGWGSCTPPAEACGNGDDDCDGMVDEGFACSPGATGPCMTSCGSIGTQLCDATCNFGACVPPAELCNGADDDCDGMIDEGCGACAACTGAAAVSEPGGRFFVPLQPHAQTGSCGGAGSEGYLTFTLTQPSDVFVTTHQQLTMDTVVYIRECNCIGAEAGCNDDADGRTTSALSVTLAPGTYNVIVDTKAPTSGTVAVDLYITTAGLPGDRCGAPAPIAAATTSLSGNTCAFANDYAPPSTTGCNFTGTGASPERVYYFVIPTARTVTFDGCVAGSSFDETAYLRRTCTDNTAAAMPACNDDGCGGSASCTAGLRSSISASSLPAGLYYFFSDGYTGTGSTCPCGDFSYTITGL